MKTAKFVITAAAAAAFSFAGAGDALAQACIGTPTASGQRALAVGAGFPEGGTSYNAELNLNMSGPLSVYGAYTHTSTPQGAGNVNTAAAGAAYRLPTPVDLGQFQISVCPTAGLQYGVMSDGNVQHHQTVVPVGVGFGTRLDVGAGMALTPYVLPEFYVERASHIAAGQRQVTDGTGLRATVGTALDFGPFFAGVDYTTHYDADPRDLRLEVPVLRAGHGSQVGLRIGVKF